jgi:hypothetical protein
MLIKLIYSSRLTELLFSLSEKKSQNAYWCTYLEVLVVSVEFAQELLDSAIRA